MSGILVKLENSANEKLNEISVFCELSTNFHLIIQKTTRLNPSKQKFSRLFFSYPLFWVLFYMRRNEFVFFADFFSSCFARVSG